MPPKQKNAAPVPTSAVALKIHSLMKSLTHSERKVAAYILEHANEVIYLSVAELALQCGVSDPTVVRTCQKLGMSGYQELKVTLAQSLVSPLESLNEEIHEGDGPQVILDKVFQTTIHTLRYTHELLKAPELKAAADKLKAARNIMIFGLGNSSAVALDLQHKLMRLGLSASAYSDTHMAALAATYATGQDVAVAISHSGSSKEVVDTANLAKASGACLITLTSLGISPLSKLADIALHTASNETKYRIVALSSRVAQITIIDALYTLIAVSDPRSISEFKPEKALKDKKY